MNSEYQTHHPDSHWILSLFSQFELSNFWLSFYQCMYTLDITCERNSSCNFSRVFFKLLQVYLSRSACSLGLVVNLNSFLLLFLQFELRTFYVKGQYICFCAYGLAIIIRYVTFVAAWTTSILAQLLPKHILFRYFVSCDHDSSYNSTWIFLNLCRCFFEVRFGSNPQINRLIFVLSSRLLPKHIDTGYLVNATPPAILPGSHETLHVFL